MDGLTSASPTPERNFSCDMMINNTLPSQNDNNQQRQELQRQNQQNQHQYQYSTSVILSDTNTQIDCGQSSDTLDGSIHAQTTNAKIFMAISTPPRVRTSVENAVDSFEGRIGKDSASVTEAEPYSPVSQGVAELGAQCQDGMGTTMDDGKSHEHDGLPQIARQLTLDSVATAEPEHASVGAVNHNINMLDTSAINDSTARLNCDQSYETSEDVRMEEASTPPQCTDTPRESREH
ncbi:hypothetical protein SARC_06578 [Sphaeroforma arctica JP610]|uniref:Uncharacterized protein n=1 Tax=Sphaeroforma arctica JP610 TaxID=667725 RepID=A0A0L0FWT1_9EUKA|nr:hypothetical protein SARC_06578 [Sphaeroforma arctica JP610]KNC81074.1 hypothetical protein SARC_06578 [Sphaeroforma arctica JP610]|eukprot:XP_014154976.1 hypothetical protein SARC_06578 [Sphaeroforma arctica JP610]